MIGDFYLSLIFTVVVGLGLVKCGAILGRNSSEWKFIKLLNDLDHAKIINLNQIEAWMKKTNWSASSKEE